MPAYRSASGSSAEELFSDTFGAEKAGYLYAQYPFSDIYQNSRFANDKGRGEPAYGVREDKRDAGNTGAHLPPSGGLPGRGACGMMRAET